MGFVDSGGKSIFYVFVNKKFIPIKCPVRSATKGHAWIETQLKEDLSKYFTFSICNSEINILEKLYNKQTTVKPFRFSLLVNHINA